MKADIGDVVIVGVRVGVHVLPVIGKVQLIYPARGSGGRLYEVQYWDSDLSVEVAEASVLKVLRKA
jgi:hypothetical protein